MSLANFIPELWSAEINSNLNKALVYGQPGVINRDYQGEISQQGDTVRINSIGRVSVRDYNAATGLSTPDTLDSFQQTLLIDQAKEFNFMVSDIDTVQANAPVMAEATQEAAYGLADVADKYIASLYTSAGRTIGGNGSGEPVTVNPAEAYDVLVDLSTLLSEKYTDSNGIEHGGVPTTGRWVVVDPAFYGVLRKDDRFVSAERSGTTETLRNGEVGRAAGFDILVSNNVPTFTGDGTSTANNKKIIAGHPMAWTFAEQINKTEAYRPEKFFSDALRGLHLYGAKVVRPEALAVLSVATS